MAYLGTVELKESDIRRIDITSSTSATHTLTWTAPSEQSLIVTINGVKQQNNYTVSGTTLSFTGTPATGSNNIYVVHKAASVNVAPPSGRSSRSTEVITA